MNTAIDAVKRKNQVGFKRKEGTGSKGRKELEVIRPCAHTPSSQLLTLKGKGKDTQSLLHFSGTGTTSDISLRIRAMKARFANCVHSLIKQQVHHFLGRSQTFRHPFKY